MNTNNTSQYFNFETYPDSIKSWWIWFRSTPLSLKWFLWLILLRPVIDLFWQMKEDSIVSPLQLTGFLTVIFSMFYILSLNVRKKGSKRIKIPFLVFSFFLSVNLLFLVLLESSFFIIGFSLRTILPVFLFLYLLKVITDEIRLKGLLFTFLISSVLPLLLITYELIISPITIVPISEERGGGLRLTGPYADLFNYMAYLIGDFIILTWLFLHRILKSGSLKKFVMLYLIIGFIFWGIYNLRHQASISVFIVLISLFIYFSFKIRKAQKYVIPILIAIVIGGSWFYYNYVKELFAKEISAYRGEISSEQSLNGRILRWEKYFQIWETMPVVNKLTGVGSSDNKTKVAMMSGGMHSDYVRFLFSTGIIGILFYLIFYYSLYKRRYFLPDHLRYLLLCCIIAMLLYSVSSNPLGSSGALLYLVLAVFAFSSQRKYLLQIGRTKN